MGKVTLEEIIWAIILSPYTLTKSQLISIG